MGFQAKLEHGSTTEFLFNVILNAAVSVKVIFAQQSVAILTTVNLPLICDKSRDKSYWTKAVGRFLWIRQIDSETV